MPRRNRYKHGNRYISRRKAKKALDLAQDMAVGEFEDIDLIGKSLARRIHDDVPHMTKLEELETVHGLGPGKVKMVVQYLLEILP